MKLASASERPCMESAANCRSRDPAFGAIFQRGDVFRREAEAHRVVEKLGGFGGRKAQIGGAQFGQLAARAQPGQRE